MLLPATISVAFGGTFIRKGGDVLGYLAVAEWLNMTKMEFGDLLVDYI